MSYVYSKSGVTFTGRLTREPERKVSNSGNSYTNISVAVTTGPKQDGEKYAPSIVVGTTVHGAEGCACMRLHKGDTVTVNTMAIESREGQDGKKWYNAMAESVQFSSAVLERLCLQGVVAAVDAVDPNKELAEIPDEDARLPF